MFKVFYLLLIAGLSMLFGCQGSGVARSYIISESEKRNQPEKEFLSDEKEDESASSTPFQKRL